MEEKKKKGILIIVILLVLLLLVMGWFLFLRKVEYEVTIDYNNTVTLTEKKVMSKGSTINDIAVPTREGYKFLYWTVDGKRVDSTYEITKDLKIVAIWEETKPKIKIKLNNDGGEGSTEVEVEEGAVLTEPTKPTKEGYKFLYWESSGEKYDFTKPVTEEIELKAVWQKVVEYIVTFNSNGGSSVSSEKVEKDSVVAKPTDPTRSGYEFVAWLLNGTKYDFNTKVTKNITLTAKWKKDGDAEKFKVTFKVDNKVYKTDEVEDGGVVTKPTNPTKSNYTFKSWQLNGKEYDFKSKVTKDITLTALFVLKLTYKNNDGSGCTSKTVSEGSKWGNLCTPTRSGYEFVGWYTAISGGTKITEATKATGNLTVYAHWKAVASANNYRVVATRIDSYSPQVKLTVYNNNTNVTNNVKTINATDGTKLGFSLNITDIGDIPGGKVKIIFNDNSEVTAPITVEE